MQDPNQRSRRGALIVCVDSAKLQFPEYVQDPIGTNDDVEAAARMIISSVLATELNGAPEPGREITLIAVGSPASGKTATLDSASEETVGLKIEGSFGDLESALVLIQHVIDSGRKPVILWIYVDDPAKTVDRMVKRAKNIGRVDRIDDMAKAYDAVPHTLRSLKNRFGDQLKVHVVDNSGAPGEAQFVEDIGPGGRRSEDEEVARAGWIQVYSTNQKFKKNPDYEVPY
jgi:hypothetical protein